MNKFFVVIPLTFLLIIACDGKKKVKSSEVDTLTEEVEEVDNVLIDNDYIKAIRVELEPDEALPWHEGKERVMFPLNDFQLKIKGFAEDEEAADKFYQKHVANWFEEEVHSTVNTGTTDAEYLIVMRKDKEFPEGTLFNESELKEAENLNETLLYDNPSIRISRVKLEAGDTTSLHSGIYRLTYPLTDFSVRYDKENQAEEIRNIYKGVAHWHLPDEHKLANVSNEGIADFIVFEFKL